jgi:mycofactocin system glycosyltransferase
MSAPIDDDGIPANWSIELDPATRRSDGGRVLIGGAPLRVLRLTAAGSRWLAEIARGSALSSARRERRLARRLVDAGLAHPRPAPGVGPSRRDVVLVVPVRDMANGLATTLATVGDVGEVIVVDDGSRDARALRVAAGGARVLRHEQALGPAVARERGWRASELPIVAFVDAEVAAGSCGDWLAGLLPLFDDPAVGAVAPRVRAAAGDAPEWLAAYERSRSPLDRGPVEAPVRPGGGVPFVPSTALLARRDALESIGGFDAALRVGEDVDLVWRLHDRGWRVRYDPTVEVTHPSRTAVADWLRQRVTYGTSAAPLAQRHGPAVAALRVSVWAASTWLALVLGHPVLAAGMSAGRIVVLARKLRPLVDRPGREALRLVVAENLLAVRQIAEAVRRPWWPVALTLALVSRRARPALLTAFLLPAVIDAVEQTGGAMGAMARFGLLRLADDVAYGTGVWIGCGRQRSLQPLLPSFSRRERPIGERSRACAVLRGAYPPGRLGSACH